MTPLGDLPAELISSILGHVGEKNLYACTFINKAFYKATRPMLWRRLDIRNQATFSKITTAMAATKSSPGKYVRHLHFNLSDDAALAALIECVPLLTHLTLTGGTGITDTSFQHLPSFCPHLTHLVVSGATITQRSMVALGHGCHQLRHVELEYCYQLDSGLFAALAPCAFLEHLTLTRCHMTGMADSTTFYLDMIGLRHLTTLTIRESPYDLTRCMTTLYDRAGRLSWPRLTCLCLDACSPLLDDAAAAAFIQTHPHLTQLEFTSSHITDLTLHTIATHLPDINTLGLDGTSGITPRGVRRLIKQCLQLTSVSTFGCQIFPDDFPEANEMYFECEGDDLMHVSLLDQDTLDEIRSGVFDDSDEESS